MSVVGWLVASVVIAGVLALGVVMARFARKRAHIALCAAAASDSDLEDIYGIIETLGEVAPAGFVLGRTNRTTADTSRCVAIPQILEDFPWAGKAYAYQPDDEAGFKEIEAATDETRFLGQLYRPVAVPRYQIKSEKLRNAFAPQKYVQSSDALRTALAALCPDYPTELLAYLLCIGRDSFEFDGEMQGRIGTSAAWVQEADFQTCDHCKRRMSLILQIPGKVLDPKSFGEGVLYLFGCKQHPEATKTVTQFY